MAAAAARTRRRRRRWEAFDGAFGTQPGGRACLAQLLQLLHNMVAAAERLPVHRTRRAATARTRQAAGRTDPDRLHPLTNADGTPTAPSPPPVAAPAPADDEDDDEDDGEDDEDDGDGDDGVPAGVPSLLQLSIDPLVRFGELERLILRTSPVSDESYTAYCDRLVGATIDERPPPAAGPGRRGAAPPSSPPASSRPRRPRALA